MVDQSLNSQMTHQILYHSPQSSIVYLLLRSGPTLPPGAFVNQDLYRHRWRQVQYLADVFWCRWLKEYLPALQQRQKWLQPKRNLQVGDLVIILHEKYTTQSLAVRSDYSSLSRCRWTGAYCGS